MSEHALSSILLNKFSDESLLKLPNNLNKSLRLYFNSKETKEIEKAYTVAFYAHANQKRRDGSKYITHPVEVAKILADIKMDKESI